MALPSLSEYAASFDRLAPALLNAAAASALVLGLAALASRALRRASAAARHEVWLLGFTAALLVPLLSAALPGWPVLPRHTASDQPARAVEAVSIAPRVLATRSPALPPLDSSATTLVASSAATSAGPLRPAAATAAAPAPPVNSLAVSTVPRTALTRPVHVPWVARLLLCWAIGTLLVLCRVVLGHVSLWSLRRKCAPLTGGELFDLLERLMREMRLRRPVELLSSPVRTMPMTWGLWRARLLVPAHAADWPPGQQRDVLLHELGHVRRWDCLTQLLSQVACAVYWFNPLAWFAGRRMQVERERACDDLVLNHGTDASAYARHLLDVVQSVPTFRLAGAAVAMGRPSTLEERMRAILNSRLNRGAMTARATLAMILLLLSALVPAAILKAQQSPTDAPPANGGGAERPRGGNNDTAPASPATRAAPPGRTGAPGAPMGPPGFSGVRSGDRPRGFGGGGSGFGLGAPALGEGPTCTLDATLYDVRIPVEKIGRLDVDALSKASASAEAFEKALAALGTVRPMYRTDQSVRLSGDTITIGSEIPLVTESRVSADGKTSNSIQYFSTGALFSLAGKIDEAGGGVDLDLGIQLSSTSDAAAVLTDKVKAAVMRKATLSHRGPVRPGKPFLVMSVDAGAVDAEGKAVAYIGRITLGDPEPPSAK